MSWGMEGWMVRSRREGMGWDEPMIHSRDVVWQERPIAAVLEAVTRSGLRDRPRRADGFGIAIRSTEIKSSRQITLVAAATHFETKIELVGICHGDALSCCESAGGVGLALRLRVGHLGPEEP